MEYSQRRVHKLRISSQNENDVSSDVNVLRDAFNIASLPGLPPHGLLLVKKLELGAYSSQSTSLSISKLIDKRFLALDRQSFCFVDGDQTQQNLVWFSDTAHAMFCLVKSILQTGSAQAWYWTTLFPSWLPGMNLTETLVALDRDYPEHQGKPFVFAQIIEQLLSQTRPQIILTMVTTGFARKQLAGSGFIPGLAATDNSQTVQTSNLKPVIRTRWQNLLRSAVTDWGGQDIRTVWIAYSALILNNPALIESSLLPPLLNSLIEYYLIEAEAINADDNNAIDTDSFKPGVTSPGSNISFDRIKPELVNQANKQFDPLFEDKSHRANKTPPQPSNKSRDENARENARVETVDVADSEISISAPLQNSYAGFVHCNDCGLAFVISLLETLSIEELLSLNPALAALNLPVRIIVAVAQRLGIADTHPVLQAMPNPVEASSDSIDEFLCPPGWQTLINTATPEASTKSLFQFQLQNHDSKCYITDRSKKLLLYVGNAENLPDWMSSYQVLEQKDNNLYPTLGDLQTTIQLLMSRYLYRYAKINLRNLVNRMGRIAHSNTHLDILFDSKQIDIRIRIGGLDINPGWVPWCARVVQFHYHDGSHGHA